MAGDNELRSGADGRDAVAHTRGPAPPLDRHAPVQRPPKQPFTGHSAGNEGAMERGSSKHSPRVDEQMSQEVLGTVQGIAGGRAEEW